jgi:hypothetical protein
MSSKPRGHHVAARSKWKKKGYVQYAAQTKESHPEIFISVAVVGSQESVG